MSKRFLTPLGLLSATSDPVSASTGDIYFNSSSNVTRVYYGSAWVNLSASSILATHANTASSIAGSLVSGTVASATVATTSGHANTASSINALLLTGTTLPAAIVSSSLTGVGTLANLTVTNTISGRAASATVATHAGTASSIAGSLVTGTVASATVSSSSNFSALSTTQTSGNSSTSIATTAFVSNMIKYNGATSPTTASVAGHFVIAVSPGTSLNGSIMIPQGATGRTLNALVDRGINGAASAGYIRGYVENNAGTPIAVGNAVPLYYIAW